MKIIDKDITAICLITFLVLTSLAYGAEIEDVVFEDSVTVDGKTLSVRGAGLFRYLGVIKAYVGALYLDEGIATEDWAAVTYRRSLSGYNAGGASQEPRLIGSDRAVPRVRAEHAIPLAPFAPSGGTPQPR